MARQAAMPSSNAKNSSKRGKPAGVAAPSPYLYCIRTMEDLRKHVTEYEGAALLAIVTSMCPTCKEVVIPYLEKLNAERPPLLQSVHLALLFVDDCDVLDLCAELNVTTLPLFYAYAHGEQVYSFAGSNMEKLLVITHMAAQVAQKKAETIAEAAVAADVEKQQQQQQEHLKPR